MAFLSVLVFDLLCSKIGRRDEQLRTMHSRKKMALFLVISTYNVAGTTGNDGMMLLALASRALMKFCVMC